MEYKNIDYDKLPWWAPGRIISCNRLDLMRQSYEYIEPVRKVDFERMEDMENLILEFNKNKKPFIQTIEKIKNACLYRLYVPGKEKELIDEPCPKCGKDWPEEDEVCPNCQNDKPVIISEVSNA